MSTKLFALRNVVRPITALIKQPISVHNNLKSFSTTPIVYVNFFNKCKFFIFSGLATKI